MAGRCRKPFSPTVCLEDIHRGKVFGKFRHLAQVLFSAFGKFRHLPKEYFVLSESSEILPMNIFMLSEGSDILPKYFFILSETSDTLPKYIFMLSESSDTFPMYIFILSEGSELFCVYFFAVSSVRLIVRYAQATGDTKERMPFTIRKKHPLHTIIQRGLSINRCVPAAMRPESWGRTSPVWRRGSSPLPCVSRDWSE